MHSMRSARFASAIVALALALAPMLASASTFNVIHSFSGNPDGSDPTKPLIVFGGKLFGTTCQGGINGVGTSFRIKTNGPTYLKLHDFDATPDGICPSELLAYGGNLYGTTVDCGFGCSDGAIFEMLPQAPYTVTALYGFGGTGDVPRAGLIVYNNVMYGTTTANGPFNSGNVYSFSGSSETSLHSFNGADGASPAYALTYANGSLWGTTPSGTGTSSHGTIFRMDLLGNITWQYSFTGMPDGDTPSSQLLKKGNYLYGVTRVGGMNGRGWLFKVKISNPTTPADIYSFSGPDGSLPSGDVVMQGGLVYGTTEAGGSGSAGTVYGVDPVLHVQTSLYSLNGGSDGAQPMSGVVYHQGWFYGSASSAGGSGCGGLGCGTVFRFQP